MNRIKVFNHIHMFCIMNETYIKYETSNNNMTL